MHALSFHRVDEGVSKPEFDYRVDSVGRDGEQRAIEDLGDEAILVVGATSFAPTSGVVCWTGDTIFVLTYLGEEATALAIGDDLVTLARAILDRL